jgi:hypothetical protein
VTDPLLPRHLQLIAAAVLLALLAWVFQLVRTRRLSLRDSLLWVVSTGAALVGTAFPSTLRWLAQLLGIAVPSNALFGLGFVYVLVNLLATTIAISGNAERLRRVVQECTLLRGEVEELRARVDAAGRGAAP